jgi:methane/ammonia monooxygenase subunit C
MTMLNDISSAAEVRRDGGAFRLNYLLFAVAMAVTAGMFLGYRAYQMAYGFETGLDAHSQVFHDTWMRLFYIQVPTLFGLGFVCWAWLWFTRDRNLDRITPRQELTRLFNLTFWLVGYSFMVYWTGSYFAEADGNWHQTVLRDTPITPTHIVLFYACIPIYLFFGVGSFLYAMTRIPLFASGLSLMHIFAVVGPFLILPNLGFNEWGHAYWMTEEIFSHPLHWGFVVLVWNALALAGVLLQIMFRMRALMPQVFGGMGTEPR